MQQKSKQRSDREQTKQRSDSEQPEQQMDEGQWAEFFLDSDPPILEVIEIGDCGSPHFATIPEMTEIAEKHPETTFKDLARAVKYSDAAVFANWAYGFSMDSQVQPLMPSREWFEAFRHLFGTNDGPWKGAAETVGAAIFSGNAGVLEELRTNWGLTRENIGRCGHVEQKELMIGSRYLNYELKKWGFSDQEIRDLEELKLKQAKEMVYNDPEDYDNEEVIFDVLNPSESKKRFQQKQDDDDFVFIID